MHLDHEFTVPVPATRAWPVLLDVDRVGPCMPGATITKVEGRDFEGKVKVKVGPITVTYAGQATFKEVDDAGRRAVIVAKGKEARGSGTANATITAQLHDEGDSTRVTVHTDLSITGRPAQFGRGVMADVGGKLLGRFADCLAGELGADEAHAAAAATPAAEATATPAAEATAAPAAGAAAPGPAVDTATTPATGQDAGGDAGVPPTAAGAVRAPSGSAPAAETPAGPPTAEVPPPPRPRPRPAYPRQDEAINLIEAAGGPILKRLAPVAAVIILLALLLAALRRRAR